VHGTQSLAHSEEEQHETTLREPIMVDQVCVDHVLQITALIVWQKDINGFCRLVGAALGCDGMVDSGYDGWNVRKEAIGINLTHGLLHRFGAKGTSDLFECEKFVG